MRYDVAVPNWLLHNIQYLLVPIDQHYRYLLDTYLIKLIIKKMSLMQAILVAAIISLFVCCVVSHQQQYQPNHHNTYHNTNHNNNQHQQVITQHYLCDTVRIDGDVSDCSCDHDSVRKAVSGFFSHVLSNLTSRPFFRYFRASLDKKCPFWQEERFCLMEGCSVGECKKEEIPNTWFNSEIPADANDGGGGGIDTNSVNKKNLVGGNSNQEKCNDRINSLETSSNNNIGDSSISSDYSYSKSGIDRIGLGMLSSSEFSILHEDIYDTDGAEDSDDRENDAGYCQPNDWVDMPEEMGYVACSSDPVNPNRDIYVNLLQNKERFTGYAGESAARVWRAIMEENCFGGGLEDKCLEKRMFHRLISGLRASIATHIGMEYLYQDRCTDEYCGVWDNNIPFYVERVGSHPDRVDNMYFTFLVLLRAVVKASDALLSFPIRTGHDQEDLETLRELALLLNQDTLEQDYSIHAPKGIAGVVGADDSGEGSIIEHVDECKNGFDESKLFQIQSDPKDRYYLDDVSEKDTLLLEYKQRFRNISRIMDCVVCEKCQLWGKLQILGLGTAIKILLSSEDELSRPGFFKRQEVVALVNTLNQFTKSVAFASSALNLEFESKVMAVKGKLAYLGSVFIVALVFCKYFVNRRRKAIIKSTAVADDHLAAAGSEFKITQ